MRLSMRAVVATSVAGLTPLVIMTLSLRRARLPSRAPPSGERHTARCCGTRWLFRRQIADATPSRRLFLDPLRDNTAPIRIKPIVPNGFEVNPTRQSSQRRRAAAVRNSHPGGALTVGAAPVGQHCTMVSAAGNRLPHPDSAEAAPLPPHDAWAAEPVAVPSGSIVETDIPARLDALPFGRFHVLVIVALGITWILDGLEVTLAGSLSGEFKQSAALGLSNTEVGLAGSCYLAGAVLGAFFFGWLTDRLGRKKLFTVTLVVYLLATAATGLSWNFWSFALFRFFTGAGIGGEYTAINSTIQELIPARLRGWTDLVINGSFWLGAALGAGGSIILLDPAFINPAIGWRLAFLIGAVIGLVIVMMRLWIPESPRWLVTHGHAQAAERVVSGIEAKSFGSARAGTGANEEEVPKRVRLRTRDHTPLREVANALFVTFRQRTLVGLSLMVAQAFFYNAIFFTYALILTDFYGAPANAVGWYILPFAAGNVLGPLLLGRLFDTVGRRIMIASTYAISGTLLAVTAYLFSNNVLSAQGLTAAWMIVFFFASAAASSAYLTVSEIFPLELRALAIAFFYAVGTGVGGIAGPLLFGMLINSGSRSSVAIGYWIGAALMAGAAVVQAVWGVAAERKPLEAVSRPLAFID
jgi:MFS family permease